jgi:hypothetical protein
MLAGGWLKETKHVLAVKLNTIHQQKAGLQQQESTATTKLRAISAK